jgi:hypothetical protein
MTLDELLTMCAQSSHDDWNLMSCWGAFSGPSYLGQVAETTPDENVYEETHSVRASYRPDIAIGIAWGYPSNKNWHEPWIDNFSDKSAHSDFVDFFYNGMLVQREVYVVVDGGRAYLPVPSVENQTITRWEYDFFKVLDGLERLSEFDRYIRQAGISIEG